MEMKQNNNNEAKVGRYQMKPDDDQTGFKQEKKIDESKLCDEVYDKHPPTSYLETLMHLFKGNVGSGVFGMADAIKNSGIVVGGALILIIACICVHMQHILVNAAEHQQKVHNLYTRPGYAETLELCFSNSKSERIRRLTPFMRKSCNFMICITQLGFCAVYFVFVSSNIKNVLDYHGYVVEIHILMLYVLIPIWLTALIRQLKLMAIFSTIANFCLIAGIVLTIGFASQDLPPISERKYFTSFHQLPIFFGIALFAFEAIAIVLPLKNAMKDPKQFGGTFGVLNVGMFFVTMCYFVLGEIGYWKYGEETQGSLTLNLPTKNILAQVVMLMIASGVLLGYTLELFVAVQIMLVKVIGSCKFATNHPVLSEQIFRTFLVIGTLTIAEIVPNLTLLLSLIGAVFCSFLAFVCPLIIELIVIHSKEDKIGWNIWIKNIIILCFSLTGCFSGAYVIVKEIIEQYQ